MPPHHHTLTDAERKLQALTQMNAAARECQAAHGDDRYPTDANTATSSSISIELSRPSLSVIQATMINEVEKIKLCLDKQLGIIVEVERRVQLEATGDETSRQINHCDGERRGSGGVSRR